MASDARQRRRGTLLHRRCVRPTKNSWPGLEPFLHLAQSALSLDAPRAETILRNRRTARRANGPRDVGPRQRTSAVRELSAARHPGEFSVLAACTTDDPCRRPLAITRTRAIPSLATRVYPDLPPRQSAAGGKRRRFQCLGRRLEQAEQSEHRLPAGFPRCPANTATIISTTQRWTALRPRTELLSYGCQAAIARRPRSSTRPAREQTLLPSSKNSSLPTS